MMNLRIPKGLVILLVIGLALTGCSQTQEKHNGLQITSMQSGIGSAAEDRFDKQRYHYSAALVNDSDQYIDILLVEPVLSREIKDRVISSNYQGFNGNIAAGEMVEIKGELIFDAEGLNKEQIIAMEPFITGFRVSTEKVLTIPGLDE